MVVGVGVDIVEIERIRKAMESPRFLARILTEKERAVCRTPEKVAGRWAVKEAIAKALGIPLSWQDVEVLNDELGAPRAEVTSPSFDHGRLRLQVSISHNQTTAVGMAVVERLVLQVTTL
ncbi:MAG: holo-ACP synthase [Fimbriimonas sp.]